jgi:hypothetical protein
MDQHSSIHFESGGIQQNSQDSEHNPLDKPMNESHPGEVAKTHANPSVSEVSDKVAQMTHQNNTRTLHEIADAANNSKCGGDQEELHNLDTDE